VRRLRREFLARLATIDSRRLVFVDESGATTAMTRLRGRAPKGQRVHGAAPHGHWQVTTMLGAIRLQGITAAMTIDCPTDSEVFLAFVERVLAPALRPGDVVVMDNLSPHKAAGVAERIHASGAELIYQPPYSPDLNPIEPGWSKVKEFLRAAEARTKHPPRRTIAAALQTISPKDARGWFRHCGYIGH
jgi:transposase